MIAIRQFLYFSFSSSSVLVKKLPACASVYTLSATLFKRAPIIALLVMLSSMRRTSSDFRSSVITAELTLAALFLFFFFSSVFSRFTAGEVGVLS